MRRIAPKNEVGQEETTPSHQKHSPDVFGSAESIPNTVVKTHSGEDTWRATARENNSLPTLNLKKTS